MANFTDIPRTKQTGRLVRVTDLHIVERHQAMAQGPHQSRHHRHTRDIAAPTRGLQVPPSTNVQVAQPKGIHSLEAIAGDLEGHDPLAPGPSRRRPHRHTRDIAVPPQGLQVLPPADV